MSPAYPSLKFVVLKVAPLKAKELPDIIVIVLKPPFVVRLIAEIFLTLTFP